MRTCVSLIIVLSLVGCGGKPQFSNREEFHELEPYAQEYVQNVLDTHFGTPTDMVVWDRLPLKPHFASGKIAGEPGERELLLELAVQNHTILDGTEILWMTSPAQSEGGESENSTGEEPEFDAEWLSAWVRHFDADSSTAELDERLATLPASGDTAIVGPGQVLAQGRLLYAEHCQHCHGVSGDGNGPTAPYLNPPPRDYRKGIFKFTTTNANSRAQREDLARVIENGIAGTYMPSFKLLTDDEMTSIIEYVMWLSMRGELEYQLVKTLTDQFSQESVRDQLKSAREQRKQDAADGVEKERDEYTSYKSIQEEFDELISDPDEIPAQQELFIELITSRWKNSQDEGALLEPKESYPGYNEESIERGRKLYLSADLNCVACHGEAGYGDGPQTYSITKDLESGEENEMPGLYDNWGNPIKPRNLHTGIFRGGRRPIDLYARVHAGIKGTPMPAFGAKLSDQQIWDIVNYVYSVPFEEEFAGAGKTEVAEEDAAEKKSEESTDVALN